MHAHKVSEAEWELHAVTSLILQQGILYKHHPSYFDRVPNKRAYLSQMLQTVVRTQAA